MHQDVDRRTFLVGLAMASAHGTSAGARDGFADGAQRGSVSSDHVWTPGRDAQGVITQASVAALPLNTWVKVAGTQLSTLADALAKEGWRIDKMDWSNGKNLRSTLAPWVGCARNGFKIYYPRGGGHGDSSINGTWVFDVATMRWGIVDIPSDPAAPEHAWDASYGRPFNKVSFSLYTAALPTDDGLYRDILPDGRPTSAHTYNGVWYDSKRHLVGTGRVSKWTLDLAKKRWQRQRWTWMGGAPTTFTIQQQFQYHAGRDALYGFPGRSDGDYYSFGKCAADEANWKGLAAPPNWAKTAISSCRLDRDKVLFLWYHNKAERWGIYDMSAEAWLAGSGGAVGEGKFYSYHSEHMPALHVPTWGESGQIIRRGTGNDLRESWWVFDLATKANLPYEREGARAAGYSAWPGNKWLGVEEAGLCIMLDDAVAMNQPAMLAMRYR